jgi:hypothetical protein
VNDSDAWPMPVEKFLAGDYLKRSDIILCKGKRSLYSRAIRRLTNSFFSHAALIFLIPDPKDGFYNTFVLEAVPGRGVSVTNLRYYLIDAATEYDLVVKRLEEEWFTDGIQRLVRGHMLDFIQARYDYHVIWQHFVSILRHLLFGVRVLTSGFKFKRAIQITHDKGKLVPERFICSGFIQYGFVEAIRRLVERHAIGPEKLNDVIFNPNLSASLDIGQVLSTTPEDMASSEKTAWKYLITGGKVHQISTAAEAARFLGS